MFNAKKIIFIGVVLILTSLALIISACSTISEPTVENPRSTSSQFEIKVDKKVDRAVDKTTDKTLNKIGNQVDKKFDQYINRLF